jgi:hypothetical protein
MAVALLTVSRDDYEICADTGIAYAVAQDVAADWRADEMVAETLMDDLERVSNSPRRVRRHRAFGPHHRCAVEMAEAMWEFRPINPLDPGKSADWEPQLSPAGISPALNAFLALEWVAACAQELTEIALRELGGLNRAQRRLLALGRQWLFADPDHLYRSDRVDGRGDVADAGPPGHLASISPLAAHAPPASTAAPLSAGELAMAA